MISNQLLSLVIGLDAVAEKEDGFKLLFSFYAVGEKRELRINLYQLAHKCKEWVYKNNYGSINSFPSGLNYGVIIMKDAEIIFENYISTTEPEAIFQACQWIIDTQMKCSGILDNKVVL